MDPIPPLHRLLQCPELLAEIFSYLELSASPTSLNSNDMTEINNEHRKLRKTLAAAALSCRALSGHALAVLWRRLDSVQPLLSLLSKRKRQFPKSNITRLQADITEQSWLRFQSHARHVRALHDLDWSAVHPSTWAFIGRWCGTVPLLPNLEELSVLPLIVQSPITMMFISPKLRSLSLFVRYDESESEDRWLLQRDTEIVKTLIRQIVSTAPGIRTLSIKSNLVQLPPSCLSRIRELDNLTTLHAQNCALDYALLRWLGGCPNLHTLSGTIDMAQLPPRQGPEDENYAPFYGFNQIQHLHVRGPPADLHVFLDYAVPCCLKTHSLEFACGAAPDAIARCVEVVWDNDRTRRSVLRELTLRYPEEESYRDEDAGDSLQHAALVDVVRPALAIRGLRKVTLAFHEIPSLDDAGVLEMVGAWPRLTGLHILPSTGARYHAHTKLTPAVVVALARQCPRLVELTLPEVKLGDVGKTDTEMPIVGQRAMRKLRLYFCHSGYQDNVLYTAALFLDRLFPRLDLHPSWEGDEEDDDEDGQSNSSWDERGREAEKTWRRIEEYLYFMQLGRRHRAMLKNVALL